MIDWIHFTPGRSLAGGLLIGVAAGLFVLFNGRIAGVSGIVGGLLRPVYPEWPWRLAFIAGLMFAPAAYALFGTAPVPRIEASAPVLAIAGLLVGYGSRAGGGCTSGHGVCGLSRLSSRSLAATLTFMAAGLATVYLARHMGA